MTIIMCIHIFISKNKPNTPSKIMARYLTVSILLEMFFSGIVPIPTYIQNTPSPISPSSRLEIHSKKNKMEYIVDRVRALPVHIINASPFGSFVRQSLCRGTIRPAYTSLYVIRRVQLGSRVISILPLA
ncbi:hypothetical protein Igag_0924 [Ignisphaera aggregans DSM 17230]|uniref:Uncharacterized protein n=1 Tax=Ignisphaera aggregans (strain DSM 17230 / JCM 13409 / AQ1.S1) TaxID=583356 RepID=E0STX4_IGNAA|nr:hypothetical protein Igag_0924 [Ignisphaera aggregans DSM 17230]